MRNETATCLKCSASVPGGAGCTHSNCGGMIVSRPAGVLESPQPIASRIAEAMDACADKVRSKRVLWERVSLGLLEDGIEAKDPFYRAARRECFRLPMRERWANR